VTEKLKGDPLVDMKHWYVVRTKPRQEATAETNLRQQGYGCMLPMMRGWRRRKGQRMTVTEPCFPGYVFAELELGNSDLGPIRSSRGVSGLVRFGERIPPLPQGFMAELLRCMDTEGLVEGAARDFQPGEQVSVVDGPLTGYHAVFEAHDGDQRAILLLDMLGRQQRVRIPKAALALQGA